MEILYSDNHLLAVNKPAGMPTQADEHSEQSLDMLAKAWVKKEYAKPGAVFLEPIHRLDKPVSGIVLFARTSKALSRLNEQMRERKIIKTYYALVEGIPQATEATLEHYLIHDEYHARVVPPSHKEAKKAILHYKLLEIRNRNAYLEITLETGRYHQIRAQLAAVGHPIVGDAKYGSSLDSKNGIALKHGKMKLIHPVTGQELVITFPG